MPHHKLIKQYHTICTQLGMTDEDSLTLLAGYGVTTSKDLSNAQLFQIIERLQPEGKKPVGVADPPVFEQHNMDTWRKRVMASIGGYLRLMGYDNNAEAIKAVACRATSIENFNKIPLNRLVNIYNLFNQKQKDIKEVRQMHDELLKQATLVN
jgi:hypothetical protein